MIHPTAYELAALCAWDNCLEAMEQARQGALSTQALARLRGVRDANVPPALARVAGTTYEAALRAAASPRAA